MQDESVPVLKKTGDKAIGGTVNRERMLLVKAPQAVSYSRAATRSRC